MPYVFVPPMIEDTPWVNAETPPLARRLFRYYGPLRRGRTVLLIDGHYVTVDNPDQLLLEGLTPGVDYFQGGHTYVVSDPVGEALIDDGYGGSSGGSVGTGTTWGDHSSDTWDEVSSLLWEAM